MLQPLLDSLAIDPRVLLINAGLFLVLLFAMDRMFWKPIMRHLDKRKEQIAGAYEVVDQTRGELDRLREEYQGRLAAMEADARTRIQSSLREAQARREEMLAEARTRAEAIGRDGVVAMSNEHSAAVAAMAESLDTVALQVLSATIGSEPDDSQRRLVHDYIAQNVTRS